jgi:hypothetical protein
VWSGSTLHAQRTDMDTHNCTHARSAHAQCTRTNSTHSSAHAWHTYSNSTHAGSEYAQAQCVRIGARTNSAHASSAYAWQRTRTIQTPAHNVHAQRTHSERKQLAGKGARIASLTSLHTHSAHGNQYDSNAHAWRTGTVRMHSVHGNSNAHAQCIKNHAHASSTYAQCTRTSRTHSCA